MKKILIIAALFSFQIFAQNFSNNTLELENQFTQQINTEKTSINLSALPSADKKNPGLAILYSVLLPGMGELYAGSYESGKYFTIAEGVLWGTFIGMNSYGNWQRDRYKSYAQTTAGANVEGKDEDYFANLSLYISIDEYNDDMAKNRNFKKMYTETGYDWDWGTVENRKTYRGLWTGSEGAFNNLRFVVGAMVLNRIASAINAVRLVAAYNKRTAAELSWNLSAGLSNSNNMPTSLTINFLKTF